MDSLEIGIAAVVGLAVAPLLRLLIDDIPTRPLVRASANPLKDAVASRASVPVVSWFADQPAATLVPVGSPDSVADGETRPIASMRWRAPLIDVITSLVFALVVWRFGLQFSTIPLLIFSAALVVGSTIDIDHYRLPDRLVFPAFFLSAAFITLAAFVMGEPRTVLPALVGAIGYFFFLFVFFVISPSGMGFGDVKLALLLGLVVGWVGSFTEVDQVIQYHGVPSGLRLVLMSGLFGSLLGTVVGLSIIPFRGRKAHFPFGPSLCLGAFLAIIFSEQLL